MKLRSRGRECERGRGSVDRVHFAPQANVKSAKPLTNHAFAWLPSVTCRLTGRKRRRAAPTRRRPWVARLGVLLLTGSILSLPAGVAATPGTDDYPGRLKIAAQDALVDPWLFYNRECTSFVAWRLNNDNGVAFHNYYLGVHWGDASNWRALRSRPASWSTPCPSVVRLRGGLPGQRDRRAAMWPGSRARRASSIKIEEYNYLSRGRYDTRTIQRSSSLWPSAFIHVGQATTLKNTARPSITGTAQVGQRLTAARGSWSMTGLDFSFQWLADGVAIAGRHSQGAAAHRGPARCQDPGPRLGSQDRGEDGLLIVRCDRARRRSASSRSRRHPRSPASPRSARP